jgi:hypothetical protein
MQSDRTRIIADADADGSAPADSVWVGLADDPALSADALAASFAAAAPRAAQAQQPAAADERKQVGDWGA